MTHIPVIVKVVGEVVPGASFEREFTSKVVSVCPFCGGIVFYQVVDYNYEDSEYATDTCTYCAVCGELQGGIINDPFDEVKSLEVGAEWWRMPDWNTLKETWKRLPSALKKKIKDAGRAPSETAAVVYDNREIRETEK